MACVAFMSTPRGVRFVLPLQGRAVLWGGFDPGLRFACPGLDCGALSARIPQSERWGPHRKIQPERLAQHSPG